MRVLLDTILWHLLKTSGDDLSLNCLADGAVWREAMPDAESHTIVCIGTLSQPPESLDVNLAISHKVFLDMQLNQLASQPDWRGYTE